MMKCCLCLVSLPSANKRRRLYGASSCTVLELFKVEATRLGLAGVVPLNSVPQMDHSFVYLIDSALLPPSVLLVNSSNLALQLPSGLPLPF